jgi:hypothetical protein
MLVILQVESNSYSYVYYFHASKSNNANIDNHMLPVQLRHEQRSKDGRIFERRKAQENKYINAIMILITIMNNEQK